MANRHYTLTARNGAIIGRSENVRKVEDQLARIIEADGIPPHDDPSYLIHAHWTTDGRIGDAGRALSHLVLGCDTHGWWQLDGSGVPETAAPARKLDNDGGSR